MPRNFARVAKKTRSGCRQGVEAKGNWHLMDSDRACHRATGSVCPRRSQAATDRVSATFIRWSDSIAESERQIKNPKGTKPQHKIDRVAIDNA